MFDGGARLLYVGKASDIRRRLAGHSRGPKHPDDVRGRHLVSTVREVRWIVCPSDREAHCLEADLIVAFVPPFNASMSRDTHTYIHVSRDDEALRFSLTDEPSSRTSRVYGGLPHLGKGRASWRGVRTNAGYSALMRLLWVAFADEDARVRIPARLRGSSPPVDHRSPFDHSRGRELHDLLSGRSPRLLTNLRASDGVPRFMRTALADDLIEAEEFYVIGPRRLRALRVRHALRPAPVDPDTFARLVIEETVAAVGPFTWQRSPTGSRRRLVPSGEA